MDSLIETVHEAVQNASEADPKKLIDSLNGLALSVEEPQDTMQRLLYQHVYISVCRAACDLKLFNSVVDSPDTITVNELAKQSSASPALIARLMRYLSSVGAVREAGCYTYSPNKTTKTLANPAWQSAIYHNFDTIWPCFLKMPDFLKETSYQVPEDPANCPFTKGHGVKEPAFAWLPKQDKPFYHFNQYMTIQRDGMPTWLANYPHLEKAQSLAFEQPLFVDVGGGLGQSQLAFSPIHSCDVTFFHRATSLFCSSNSQSIVLRESLPKDTKGRIIVQDQPCVIEQALKRDGVEHMAHDFFTPQPVKDAKMYYMRNIMHDWPDHKALEILKHIKDAMGPESVLLIDEMVLPDTGAHWQATQLDMLMMVALAARERTLAQWEELIKSAGFKINRIYTSSLGDSIIECLLPTRSAGPE